MNLRRYKMTTQDNHDAKAIKAKKRRLDRKIESVGWALFFIWSAVVLIAPDELIPEGSWLIGTGLIIIASMGIRYLYGIRIDGFWMVLGFFALGFGISEYFGLNLPFLPVILIILGVVIVYNAFFRKIYRKNDFWRHCWHRNNFWKHRRHNNEFWRDSWQDMDFWECCRKGENDEKA